MEDKAPGVDEQAGKNAEPLRSGEANLRLYAGSELLFSSTGKWLHPLFELERFLGAAGIDPRSLRLEDKIVGKAAAMLMLRMGFRTVHGTTMSLLAREVFEKEGVQYTFDRLVERIDCQTETLLADEDDLERAYALLAERANK